MGAAIPVLIALGVLAMSASGAKASSESSSPTPKKKHSPKAKPSAKAKDDWKVKILPAELTNSNKNPATTDDPKVSAARALAGFMLRTGKTQGAEIAQYQARMGGIEADGKVGPKTRARAAALGVILPAQGRQLPQPVTPRAKPKPHVTNLPPVPIYGNPNGRAAQRPPAPPEPAKPRQPAQRPTMTSSAAAPGLTPSVAARQYQAYITGGGSKGSKAKPSAEIKKYQAAMGKLVVDGIDGPKTQARARALLTVDNVRNGSPAPVVTQQKQAALTPKDYALALRNHLESGGSRGTKAAPSAAVKASQLGMGGGLVPDGQYGPKTQARASALGVTLKAATQYKAA